MDSSSAAYPGAFGASLNVSKKTRASTPHVHVHGNWLASSTRIPHERTLTPKRPGHEDYASMWHDIYKEAAEPKHLYLTPKVDLRGYHGKRPYSGMSDPFARVMTKDDISNLKTRLYEEPLEEKREYNAKYEQMVSTQLVKMEHPEVGYKMQREQQAQEVQSDSRVLDEHSMSQSEGNLFLSAAGTPARDRQRQRAMRRQAARLSDEDTLAGRQLRQRPLTMTSTDFADKFYENRVRKEQRRRKIMAERAEREIEDHGKAPLNPDGTASNPSRVLRHDTSSPTCGLQLKGVTMSTQELDGFVARHYGKFRTVAQKAEAVEKKIHAEAFKKDAEDRASGKTKYLSRAKQDEAVNRFFYEHNKNREERQRKREEKYAWKPKKGPTLPLDEIVARFAT